MQISESIALFSVLLYYIVTYYIEDFCFFLKKIALFNVLLYYLVTYYIGLLIRCCRHALRQKIFRWP